MSVNRKQKSRRFNFSRRLTLLCEATRYCASRCALSITRCRRFAMQVKSNITGSTGVVCGCIVHTRVYDARLILLKQAECRVKTKFISQFSVHDLDLARRKIKERKTKLFFFCSSEKVCWRRKRRWLNNANLTAVLYCAPSTTSFFLALLPPK